MPWRHFPTTFWGTCSGSTALEIPTALGRFGLAASYAWHIQLPCAMNDLYDQTLDNLCNLSLQIHIEGYLRLEVLTGVRIHNDLVLRMRRTLIELLSVIRCLGKGRWMPLTRVSDRARAQRAGRCGTGKRSSKRHTPIFKQTFEGLTLTLLLA